MEKVLVCLKSNNLVKIDVLDSRRKELVSLGRSILSYNKNSIATHVRKALDAGATEKDVLRVAAFIIGDPHLFKSIIDLLNILSYEKNLRKQCISVIGDDE